MSRLGPATPTRGPRCLSSAGRAPQIHLPDGDTMTPKIVNYSARCPFCGTHHHKAANLTDHQGHPVAIAAEQFTCCGYEFGFSVRRTLAAYLSGKGQVTA